METFSVLLAICAGNSPVTGEFPAQRPVTRIFDDFFDMCLNKRLSKRHRRYYDVTVMIQSEPKDIMTFWKGRLGSGSGDLIKWFHAYSESNLLTTFWTIQFSPCCLVVPLARPFPTTIIVIMTKLLFYFKKECI